MKLVAVAKTVLDKSVFAHIGKGASMETILAAMFHRASATIYLCYFIWSVVAVFNGIPSLQQANGTQWQTIFSIAVALTAAPATFGATFWPYFARLESFAGSAFVGLIFLYVGFLVAHQLSGDNGGWAGVIVVASLVVIPACRCIVVILFLMRQAAQREARYQEYLDYKQSGGALNDDDGS